MFLYIWIMLIKLGSNPDMLQPQTFWIEPYHFGIPFTTWNTTSFQYNSNSGALGVPPMCIMSNLIMVPLHISRPDYAIMSLCEVLQYINHGIIRTMHLEIRQKRQTWSDVLLKAVCGICTHTHARNMHE